MALTFNDIIPLPPAGESWRDKIGNLPWDRFCTVSLFNWLEAVRAAGIEAVPATEIWRGPLESLLKFDVREGDHIKDLSAFQGAINSAAKSEVMFRWDCCASYDVKGRLGNGMPGWHEDFLFLPIDDPRAFDLLYEYPRHEMIVWLRPWVTPIINDNYPVEFRVFVKDSEVVGASNYYPQMSLPEHYAETARQAMKLTARLIEHVAAPVWVPHDGGAERWAQDKVHGTVDWMLTESGLLFLEGGPPFGAGAHPCCFLGADGVNGVALAPPGESS